MLVISPPFAVFGILLGFTQAGTFSLPWWVISAPLWGSAAVLLVIWLVVMVLGAVGIAGAAFMRRVWHKKQPFVESDWMSELPKWPRDFK